MIRGKWFWAILAFLVVTLIIGLAFIIVTYNRASTLTDLRTQTEVTLQNMYLLTNATNSLLFTAENIYDAKEAWELAYTNAFYQLDKLASHQGLDYIDVFSVAAG